MAPNTQPRPAPTHPASEMRTALSGTPPLTTEDQLLHIRALGQRIAGHVEFMCGVGSLQGTSPESKQKAVAAFYDRLITLERELSRIQENLRLG